LFRAAVAGGVETPLAEREAAMESGALIVDGEVEFTEATTRAKDVIDQRCADVIQMLHGADGPVMAKDIHERFGGAHALLIPRSAPCWRLAS
jgi:hypothetical protein